MGFGDKLAKFSFRTMNYSPRSSKNIINWNWLKKYMPVGIYMHTNFGGRGLFDLGDIATFKNSQISLSDNGL